MALPVYPPDELSMMTEHLQRCPQRGIRLIREETIVNVLHAKYVLAVPEFNTRCYLDITDIFSERWKHRVYLQDCGMTSCGLSGYVDYADT
jgi:hypothetical protein